MARTRESGIEGCSLWMISETKESVMPGLDRSASSKALRSSSMELERPLLCRRWSWKSSVFVRRAEKVGRHPCQVVMTFKVEWGIHVSTMF